MTTPFTQFSGTFKNHITARGLAVEVNRRYYGRLRAYAAGNKVNVIPVDASKAAAARRCAEFAGVPAENVWAYGNDIEDICMLSRYNGIATADSAPEVAAAAKYKAGSVKEALEIALNNAK